jgi:hypothetical protein
MAITLNLNASSDKYYGLWVRRGRPVFMKSKAYDILETSLRQYLRREISGFSFLIAGHRGVGKTALVAEVVEAISDDLFERWETWAEHSRSNPDLESPAERQRPILVKLYGPSLVGKELPSPGGGEEPKAKVAAEGKNTAAPTKLVRRWASGSAVEVNVNVATPDAAKPNTDSRTTSTGRPQAALVQIMIGLYRALAGEVGEAAAARALDRSEPQERYAQEFAAQLRFDLDRAAGPETLRDLWEEIEPSRCGFLWPKKISAALTESVVPDQHFREIVAVATAAQAFQVCSGAVTYNQTRKDSATQERSVEFTTGFDTKDAVSRLVTLGVGGLLGYGIAGTTGAGVGLLGSLGVTAFSRRSAKRERTEDYTFIVDRSVQTLERDLPLVIERIRAAGLAPVFVVDELDKLPLTGEDGVADSIRELVNRLKHLTTDYGFFCFLTGRDYFNEVEQALAEKTYPVEHTYFTERLLIGYGPTDFNTYGSSLVLPAGDKPRDVDFFERDTLLKELILASHLNTIDFRRQLRQLQEDWRWFDGTPGAQMSGSNQRLLATALQLAIDLVVQRAREAKQIARNPDFWQMAFDVLYRVVHRWEHDEDTVDMARAAILQDLLQRRSGREIAVGDAVAAAEKEIGKANCDALCKMAMELTKYLCAFHEISDEISKADPPNTSYELYMGVLTAVSDRNIVALVRQVDQTSTYEFLFRRDGTDLFGSQEAEELRRNSNTSHACLTALKEVGITLDDLQILGFPSTLSEASIEAAKERVGRALSSGDFKAAETAAAPLAEFIKNLKKFQEAIGGVVSLCADIHREAGFAAPPLSLSSAIKSLPRHLPDPPRTLTYQSIAVAPMMPYDILIPPQFPIRDELHKFDGWRISLLNHAVEQQLVLATRAEEAWKFWLDAIMRFGGSDSPLRSDERPQFNDLVLNAAGRLPSRILRYDLAQMDAFDWTKLALAAIASQWPQPDRAEPAEYAPSWAALAGLRRQGFGRGGVQTLLSHPTAPMSRADGLTAAQRESFLETFPPDREQPPAALFVSARPLTPAPIGPYLLVTPATLEDFRWEIAWLSRIKVIQAGAYQRE